MNNALYYTLGVVKEDVIKSLEIMGYGVLAIFIVIAVLIALVLMMQYLEKKSAERRALPDYVSFEDKCKTKFSDITEKIKKKDDKPDDKPDDKQ